MARKKKINNLFRIETIVNKISYKLSLMGYIETSDGRFLAFRPIFNHDLKDAKCHMTESFVFWKLLRKKTVGERCVKIKWELD